MHLDDPQTTMTLAGIALVIGATVVIVGLTVLNGVLG